MRETSNLKKKNMSKNEAGILSIIGPVLVVLLCLIILILIRFSTATYTESKLTVETQIEDNFKIFVHEAALDLNKIMAAGSVAAGMLSDNGVDYEHWQKNVGYIYNSIDNIYMVSIVDSSGKGVCSLNDRIVDLASHKYYSQSTSPYYVITDNDGITGSPALVCVIPIKYNGNFYGYINEYIDVKTLQKLFPLEGNDTSNSFLLLDKSGEIILKTGSKVNTDSNNFFNVLRASELVDVTIDVVNNNIATKKSQHFGANIDSKDYVVFTIPLVINDWSCVQLIDYGYYNNLVRENEKDEINLVKQLAFLSFLTILLIAIVVIYNKAKDINENRLLEDKADTDLLTGLNNKIATERKIKETLEEEAGSQHLFLMFDIDNFKKINDTMGHAFGDKVIKSLGEQIRQEFRKTDILGRTGGDEFTLLIKDLKTDDIVVKECDKISEFFNQFAVGDYVKYSATASIGAAVYPRDGKTFEELYNAVDKSLYEAKKLGKNRLVYANKELMKYAENKATDERTDKEETE